MNSTVNEIFRCGDLSEEELYEAALPTLRYIYRRLTTESQKYALSSRQCIYTAYEMPEDRKDDKMALLGTSGSEESRACNLKQAIGDIAHIATKRSYSHDMLDADTEIYDRTAYPPILPLDLESYDYQIHLLPTDECMVMTREGDVAYYQLGRIISYTDIQPTRDTAKFFKVRIERNGKELIVPMNYRVVSKEFYDQLMRSTETYRKIFAKVVTRTTPGFSGCEVKF